MLAINYAIDTCCSSETTPGVITIQQLNFGGKTLSRLLPKTER